MECSAQENDGVESLNDDSDKVITHKEAIDKTKLVLETLLSDPLLQDIPLDVTPKELKAKINLEKGKAFVVNLLRDSENVTETLPIIVNNKTTVSELKKDIQKVIGRKIIQEGGTACLSWKYFWKTYWLVFKNEKLKDDRKSLKDYGMKDQSEITFIKRLRRV